MDETQRKVIEDYIKCQEITLEKMIQTRDNLDKHIPELQAIIDTEKEKLEAE